MVDARIFSLSFTLILIEVFAPKGLLLAQEDKLMICAHRGGFYDQLPENSFAAFHHTVRNTHQTSIMIEVDLRRSKDGTIFILHDETVDRTTNGTGKIAELTDAYIKSLRLKNSKGDLTSEPIPTFDSLVRFARDRNVSLMLDIKADVWTEAINVLIEEGMIEKSIFLTFRPEDSQKVYSLCSYCRISSLIQNESDLQDLQDRSIPIKNLMAYISRNTNPDFIKHLKTKSIKLISDVSEHSKGNGRPFPPEFYRKFVRDRKLDVVVTDFPIEISKILPR